MSEGIECEVLIIGGGVVGLALGANLSKKYSCVLVETHPRFGQETSSRNSEVIHSGIYYPLGSKKTDWCIEGRHRLYDYCARRRVPFSKIGKLLVSCASGDEEYLTKIEAHCKELGVPCSRLSKAKCQEEEPLLDVEGALWLPESGIVDSHAFMQTLEEEFRENSGLLAYRHRVERVARAGSGWSAEVLGPQGKFAIASLLVVNSAGLGACELSNQTLGSSKYRHKYCRGRYFSLAQKYQSRFHHLVYPVPPRDGLGIHITLDLGGFAKLGPDVEWSDVEKYSDTTTLYDCDWEGLKAPFLKAVNRYCPGVRTEDISPQQIGIRPKLFIDGKEHRDFLVENNSGFIHCLGIESPGLTSVLALADFVSTQVP